ncbi:hypothetical protein TD95_002607 [Thielaviopsis punctulata]|uniref:Fanconi-associated nuclease n=1 Tax=Thielaviopsis punctulata TaxID=72032 RepID=A0A0F4ZKM4_9PEZI|nr:hypothetical protein TD95_002607 [Thielaviopsis punctulata]
MDKFVQRLPRKSDRSPVSNTPHDSIHQSISPPHKKARISSSTPAHEIQTPDLVKAEDSDNSYLLSFPFQPTTEQEGAASTTPLEASLQVDVESHAAVEASVTSENGLDADARKSRWVKGQSSMYVDAFGMALDTVLCEEAHLFSRRELEVFDYWRELKYPEQYLYVRLFLRKTAAWHRISRLGYWDDIPDIEASCTTLQKPYHFSSSQDEPLIQPEDSLPVPVDDPHYSNSFTFADTSSTGITSVSEAVALLSLDELKTLAKEEKVLGKTKGELVQNIVRVSQEQKNLLSLGVTRRRHSSFGTLEPSVPTSQIPLDPSDDGKDDGGNNHAERLRSKILILTGPCIRLSAPIVQLFERVHLVYFRSTQWTEKSLTTSILASISRRNFPEYIVHRSSTIFASRAAVVEFEAALRLEADVDALLEMGASGFAGIKEIYEKVYPRWRALVGEEGEKDKTGIYGYGEGVYLRCFSAAHIYTRIVHKGAYILGRLKEYRREHFLLEELLSQRLFHPARRGAWYQRKALLEEHYMYLQPTNSNAKVTTDDQAVRRLWRRAAAETCERALQDNECHVIYHYDLQKRLLKLERQLCIPKRLQHDFGHLHLRPPLHHTVQGIQLKPYVSGPSILPQSRNSSTNATMKTWWLDEFAAPLDDDSDDLAPRPISVEEMCLSWYRAKQGWKGYHSEGGIVRTLFAYLFFDILFLPVPNVFQTAYQSCPLDLFTDAFYCARISEINQRLAEISNGHAARIIDGVISREGERRPVVIGLNWDFEASDVIELAQCFKPEALAAVCRVLAQEYRARRSGLPDLIMWRTGDTDGECMFVEVKSANDRVSDTQRLWMHVLGVAGVTVVVCHAVAREVREV